MKYKVSLLPAQNRKRLESRKKLEKIQIFALAILVILALFLVVVSGTRLYANNKLSEAQALDHEYAQKVAELEQFREINANLQEKVQLIQNIQVEEPMLVNFLAKISNLKSPGISITNIECTDWKTTRNCVLTGTCDSRKQYLEFEKKLGELEGVASVACGSYVHNIGGFVDFTVVITCEGGATIVTTTEATTVADGETTAETTDPALAVE